MESEQPQSDRPTCVREEREGEKEREKVRLLQMRKAWHVKLPIAHTSDCHSWKTDVVTNQIDHKTFLSRRNYQLPY